MSLRYDLTAPLARYFAENYDRLPKPYRSYRQGYVFRNEKPGPGRFRQFMQFDADTVGAAGPEADAEMCMMMADTMDALGLAGKYVVKVNNRKVLDGVLESAGLGGSQNAAKRLVVLRAIDKLDRLGADGVRDLLGPGRKDESGDFTIGAGLQKSEVERIMLLTGKYDATRIETQFMMSGAVGGSQLGLDGVGELDMMGTIFESAGYGPDRIRIDPSVVRGLEYYTGPVFEIELTFPVTNEKGQEVVFGSVGGGGRYDGLVSRFRSEPVPATGFSIGVSRLAHALKLTGNLPAEENSGLVVVLVLDRDQTARYQAIVSRLRNAGIRAEMYLGSSGMNAQMKYANRRNAAAVVIEGSNEREAGELQVKDLVAGAEAAKNIAGNAEWKAERPGQFTVKDAELVEKLLTIPAVAQWVGKNGK
jgi:histidyl-tRNA synthetase